MRGSVASTLVIWLSASLLAIGHAQVLAQDDDIPETVLITGSLLEGVDPPGPFTPVSTPQLRRLLPGTSIRGLPPLNCDRTWYDLYDFGIPAGGRYSIRDNQLCIEGHGYCVKFLRNSAGRLYMLIDGLPRPRIAEIVSQKSCARR